MRGLTSPTIPEPKGKLAYAFISQNQLRTDTLRTPDSMMESNLKFVIVLIRED